MGKYEKSTAFTDRALEIFNAINYHPMIPNVVHQIANNFHRQEKYEKAKEKYEEAYRLFEAQGNLTEAASVASNLSEVLFYLGEHHKSLKYAKEALEIGVELEYLPVQRGALHSIQKNYAALQNSEKAYEYLTKYTEVNDSLYNEDKIREVNQVEMNYAFSRQQLADSLAFNTEKIILESQVQQERQGRWFFLGIAGLLGLLAVVLFRNNQQRQQTNELLSIQKTEIEKKNQQNELLLKEIHHRVKNNLETVSSLLALQSATIEDPAVLDAMQESQNRVQSMGMIHQKLYQGENLAAIEMKDYFVNLSEGVLDSFGTEGRVQVECAMQELELDVDTAVPIGLIVNELLTNSLKYAFPNGQSGQIKISLKELNASDLELTVADDGIGKNTIEANQSKGFGTQLIQLLTRQINGRLEEVINQGTIISLQFKKSHFA